jgi:hypothetical protein
MPRRFQFSLKTMLSSVGMICIGVAMIAILHRESLVPGAVILPVVFFPTWLGGGALIGAGLSRPFGNWWIGIVVVWAVQIVATELVFGPNF